MDIEFIETKFEEIFKALEKEVLEIMANQSLDKKNTNLGIKPLTSTKKILLNALESIKMVEEISKEEKL